MVWTTDQEVAASEPDGRPKRRGDAPLVPSAMDGQDPSKSSRGISWFVAALFLVDDIAGGGIVTIPTAMVQTDLYIGIVFFLLLMGVTTYTAYALGQCWNILRNTWPIYKVHCRKPYASIGYRAMGANVRKFVSVIIDVTQFGVSVVFVLLSSKTIHDMVMKLTSTEFSYCFVVLIVAACLLPVTYLKSPQDFWLAVMVAMFTVAAAIVLVLIGIALDYKLCSGHKETPPLSAKNFFLSLGTMLFACGGHAAFPTIQHDMKNPGEYTKSVVSAYSILLSMYGPVAIFGFLTYHGAVRDSILPSIQTEWIQHACNALITIHCILTVTIIISPLNQDLEDLFHCPHHFGWQRILIRTGTMLAIVFVCESIPNFGPILDLIGGSTMTLASVILPCVFYLYLLARQKKARICGIDEAPASFREVIKYAPPKTIAICCFIIVLGVIGGAAATFSAVVELSTTSFSMPCYVDLFLHQKHPEDSGASTYCCGPYQNITHNGRTDQCVPMPKIPFYS